MKSNLACPFCGHIITDKDLKHWKCIKCGKSFKITFESNENTKTKKGKEIKDH